MSPKRLIFVTLLLLALPLHAQTADDLVAKNLAARGGEAKIKAIKSARLTGTLTAGPGMEAPFTWEWKRPNLFRMEFTVQNMTGIQAYDGTTAWILMPFQGMKDPEKLPAEETKDLEDQVSLDGPFVDYKDKGRTIELAGKEAVGGVDAYKLKLTRSNGDVAWIYLDASTFLEIKTSETRTMRGESHDIDTLSSDYREVDGVKFAFHQEQTPKGAPQGQVLEIQKIELNTDEPLERFKMPASGATATAGKPSQ